MTSRAIEINISQSLVDRLDDLASKTERGRELVIEEALDRYLTTEDEPETMVREALANFEANPDNAIGEEAMDRWIDSLDTPDELPPPHLMK